jgi:indole-3-glycerol phosphate synthase
MGDVLERIVEAKRGELEQDKARVPPRRMIEMASGAPPPRDFRAAITRPQQINIIAEVKRASPSRGAIRPAAEPDAMARVYAEAGARALSVLTETRFFLGSPDHLQRAKEAVAIPVLRKDFLFDEYQIYQSRAWGADALLLIARLLPARALATLVGVTRSLHMEALVEVHSEEEVDKAIEAGAQIIGVNNRDLATLQVSLETSFRLAPRLPPAVARVSESGIETAEDIARLRAAGYDAVLVGERLMRDTDPGAVLRGLLGGGAT